MPEPSQPISEAELKELFGGEIPWEDLRQILWDASEDRTVGDVRAEVRALAESRKRAA